MPLVAPEHAQDVIVADSVTTLGPAVRGRVLLAASHGGSYAAYLAALAGPRAVILSDAGIGRDRAGVGGLADLDALGLPMAATSHLSCRIGDGADAWRRGVVSVANAAATALDVAPGMSARDAAERLARRAPAWTGEPPSVDEARLLAEAEGPDGPSVVLMDSVSLVDPADRGAVIVTGSHGGLVGGRPETACKVDVLAALFNDAAGGIDDAGWTRLPALDGRGIAAGTVSAWSARIGDGRSTWADGVISHVNETAGRFGAAVGMSAEAFVAAMREAGRVGRR